jgi:hypothetical protein
VAFDTTIKFLWKFGQDHFFYGLPRCRDKSVQTVVAQQLHLIKVIDISAVGVQRVGRDAVGARSFSTKLALLSHLLCYRVQIGFILKSKKREVT